MVRVRCSHCPQVYQVPEAKLGSQATCKKCQHTFTLEMAADETSAPRVKTAATMSLASDATAMPRKLGHYLLRQKLGAGAMGEVWLAHDESLERDAALKLMSPGIAADPERRQRFEREAKTAARLLHPNTVAVYSFGVEGEHAYLAMELVAGTSLDKVVSSGGPLPWREATRVICDAARGLAAAHEIGLVHRDIKPANLMRTTKGVTKVVDFGLARAMTSNTQLTQEGSLLGTPAYMAPEQWMGQEVDARSDLYSLICTYYFLLTARLPYDAPSLPALGYQHRYEPFPDPRQQLANLPDGVCRVLSRGSQKDPTQRFQSGDELVAELEALLSTPDESLMFNSPWENLSSAAGTAASGVMGAGAASVAAMPALAMPSLVLSSRPQKRSGFKLPPLAKHPPAWAIAAATGFGALLLGIAIYVATNKGTIKIELSDPNAQVEVKVDGDRVELAGLAEPLRLSVREHELQVEGANFETLTQKFTVKRGNNETLTIALVPRLALGGPGILPPTSTRGGLVFDGKSYVQLPVLPVDPAQPLTLEVWATPAEHPGNTDWPRVVSVNFARLIVQRPATLCASLTIAKSADYPLGYRVFQPLSATAPGRPMHAAVVWTGTAATLFIDGQPQQHGECVAKHHSSPEFVIGGNADWAAREIGFRGVLNQVRISKVARYDRYKSFTPDAQLADDDDTLALYRFDEGSGDVLRDSSGNNYHGKIVGAKWNTPAGPAESPSATLHAQAPADARAFGGHHYKFFPELLSWKEAKAQCEAAGGHLVVIDSAEEQQFVSTLVAATAWQDSWIGITDEAQEGTWLTVTGQPLRYTNWFTNQPNNKGTGEHFGLFSGRTIGEDLGWRWSDQPNEAQAVHQPGYLCEWEPASADANASGWVSLFNGKDLTGWKTHPDQPGGWTVENGLLVGRSSDVAHLFTERADFEDFHLRAEVKLSDRSNSGIYFRSNFSLAPNNRFPKAYEVQLLNQAETGPLTGSLRVYSAVEKDPSYLRSTIMPDEWFVVEIIARENYLIVKVNDRITTDFRVTTSDLDPDNHYSRGHFVLQAAADLGARATAVASFRKIEFKDLSPSSAAARDPFPTSATPSPAPAAADEGWVPLFNGKDLTGWKKHPDDTAQWEVVNGVLRGKGGRGQLFTERGDYENFHFRVEAQINNVGNSGQYFRAVFGPSFPQGYEAQISTTQPDQKTGSLYGLVKIPQPLHKPDEWFTQEVIADGNHITISVNGKQVVDFHDPNNTYTRGHLALQQNTPGSLPQFRKVEVKEIVKGNKQSAAPPQLVPLSELNTSDAEEGAWVSADGLRIYWEKTASGADSTIWQAERATPSEPFRSSRLVARGRQPTLTPDELQLVCLLPGSVSGKSLHLASRASMSEAFNVGPSQELTQFGKLSFNNPCLSSDGLSLFVNARAGGPITDSQYFVTRRTSLQGTWSSLTPLDVKWDAHAQGAPLTWLWVAHDELSFLATHELDIGRFRVVRFTRTTKSVPFENFNYVALPGIDPVRGRAPRYAPATNELFLTALPDYEASATLAGWQNDQPDLWVIRNFRL